MVIETRIKPLRNLGIFFIILSLILGYAILKGGAGPNDCEIRAGENAIVSWHANTEPDLAGYKIFINDENRVVIDTFYVHMGITATTAYYVCAFDTAQNLSDPSETVHAYVVEDHTFKSRFTASELAEYMTIKGTLIEDGTRLGLWNGMTLSIPLYPDRAGMYKVSICAAAKHDTETCLAVNGIATAPMQPFLASVYNVRVPLAAGSDVLTLAATGDVHLYDTAVTLIWVQTSDTEPPGAPGMIGARKFTEE
jgi:hypothetical protein